MGRRLSQWEGGAELSGQPAASTPFSKTRDKDRWPPRAADNSRACLTHFTLCGQMGLQGRVAVVFLFVHAAHLPTVRAGSGAW